MCTSDLPTSSSDLAQRLTQAATGSLELFSIYLGVRLGLYGVLEELGPLDAAALALHAGIDERYALEWLEQQAVAGFLAPDDRGGSSERRRYLLPEKHASVFVDPESPAHTAPLARMLAGIAGALPEVLEAYRTGGGVAYPRYGEDFREGQGAINRPAFLRDLAGSWLPALPDVHARLRGHGARVADVGCGQGWSTIALSEAFPGADVIGIDPDRASIEDARARASARGARARFEPIDASALSERGPFDLILVLEALHDMARPDEVLASLRAALSPCGALLVADERVAEEFSPRVSDMERMMYGWSVLHCLPVSRAERPSRALGTVLRPSTVQALAEEAGFTCFEILPIEHEQFRFYRLGH